MLFSISEKSSPGNSPRPSSSKEGRKLSTFFIVHRGLVVVLSVVAVVVVLLVVVLVVVVDDDVVVVVDPGLVSLATTLHSSVSHSTINHLLRTMLHLMSITVKLGPISLMLARPAVW